MPPSKNERSFSTEDAQVQIVRVDNTALEAMNRAEVDIQISTAHAFPRNAGEAMNEARQLILAHPEITGEMFYCLPRKDGGDTKNLMGPSTRFAECLATAWGNCRVQVAIVGEDKRFVTAQAMAIDLQKNYGASVVVRRRISGKHGTYSDDMIGVTSNAAISIAYRNAVLRMIPKPYWWDIYQQVLAMDDRNPESFSTRLQSMLTWFGDEGVPAEALLGFLGVADVDKIGIAHLRLLRGAANAIKQGEWSIETMFRQRAPKAALEVVDDTAPDGASDADDAQQDDHRDALAKVRQNLNTLRGK